MSTKLLISIVALLAVVFAIYKYTESQKKETFLQYALGIKPMTSTVVDGVSSMTQGFDASYPFVQHPTYQAVIAPRQGFADGFRGTLAYDLPNSSEMAFEVGNPLYAKTDPMAHGQMVKEGFCSSCSQSAEGCGCGGDSELRAIFDSDQYSDYSDDGTVLTSLPGGTMDTVSSDGISQVVDVRKNFIYAGLTTRGYAESCYIRGDVPIAPSCTPGWFTVSASVRDLNPGAMGMIADGVDPDMWNLKQSAMSGLASIPGGQDITDFNFTTHLENISDVSVTSFV
jgi:hypothetical protein